MPVDEESHSMKEDEVEHFFQLLAQAGAQFNPYPLPQFVVARAEPTILYVTRLSHNSSPIPRE